MSTGKLRLFLDRNGYLVATGHFLLHLVLEKNSPGLLIVNLRQLPTIHKSTEEIQLDLLQTFAQ